MSRFVPSGATSMSLAKKSVIRRRRRGVQDDLGIARDFQWPGERRRLINKMSWRFANGAWLAGTVNMFSPQSVGTGS
jgi:hypothetical protein